MPLFIAVAAVCSGAARAQSRSLAAEGVPADPHTLRAAIDSGLQDLTQTLLADLKAPSASSRAQVEQDLTQISRWIEQYRTLSGPQPQAIELSERWEAFRQNVISVLNESRRETRGQAELDDLRQQAKGAIMALSLNQKSAELPQPPSLVLLNSMATQQQKVQTAERSKADSLQKFMTGWEQMVRTITQAPEAVMPEPRLESHLTAAEPPAAPGPVASLVLCISGAVLLLFIGIAEVTRKKFLQPMVALIRSAEAAATGDLSRRPAEAPAGILMRLETALNRLITVLARSENRVYHLSTLVDSADEAIISQGLSGEIITWNKGAQRLYGYSAEEVKGKSVTLLMPQESETLLTLLGTARRGEKIPMMEMRQKGRNGRAVRVIVRVAAIFDSTKNVIGTSLWAQNVSEFEAPADHRASLPSVDEQAPLF